jgi:hypothetical protein
VACCLGDQESLLYAPSPSPCTSACLFTHPCSTGGLNAQYLRFVIVVVIDIIIAIIIIIVTVIIVIVTVVVVVIVIAVVVVVVVVIVIAVVMVLMVLSSPAIITDTETKGIFLHPLLPHYCQNFHFDTI